MKTLSVEQLIDLVNDKIKQQEHFKNMVGTTNQLQRNFQDGLCTQAKNQYNWFVEKLELVKSFNKELIDKVDYLEHWKKEMEEVVYPLIDKMNKRKDLVIGESCHVKAVKLIDERDDLKKVVYALIRHLRNDSGLDNSDIEFVLRKTGALKYK